MNEYRAMVRRMADERTGAPFMNNSPDHAAIIVENMFRTAKKEVCVLTSHLAPRVYAREAVVEWAKIFLADDEDHSFRVLLRDGDLQLLKTNELCNAVKTSRNVEFRALADSYHDTINFSLMVADGDSYRFEPDKTKCEAVAAFNSETGAKCQDLFDKLWPHGRPVNLDNLESLPLSVV